MGNQQAICCADTTGCQRVDISETSSFEGYQNRGKVRLLRRIIDTIRPPIPTIKRNQVGQQPKTGFFRGKFASSTMEMDPDNKKNTVPVFDEASSDAHKKLQQIRDLNMIDSAAAYYDPLSARRQASPSLHSQNQCRSLSSLSTASEFGERAREARSDTLTRRASYCSAREDIEEDREALEPEGRFIEEAME